MEGVNDVTRNPAQKLFWNGLLYGAALAAAFAVAAASTPIMLADTGLTTEPGAAKQQVAQSKLK